MITVRQFLWGPPMLVLLLGTGIYLTLILKAVQLRYLVYAIKQVFSNNKEKAEGDISPFEALMTTLAGAIGTGAIVGVASALLLGGLGALFWMWVTAVIGMAIKYAESLLAVKYRQIDKRGEMIGGPMEYMEHGVGSKWMARLFAFLGAVAVIGIGNLVQVNSISEAANSMLTIDPLIIGVVLAVLTASVILGGVKSIGHVAGVMVPLMALLYVVGGLVVIVLNYSALPAAFNTIVTSAFNGQAAIGGFAGATLASALQMGVSRSIFSNEAGMGISSIAAAAARTDQPGRQAMITMTGALLSTGIVCSITGFAIAVTGVFGMNNAQGEPLKGAALVIAAFGHSLYGGEYVVSIGLILFAFSTIVAWAYYGEKCVEYLFGERSVWYYRILYTLMVIPGALVEMELVWHIADISNALMIIPNLIAIILLSKVILEETKRFLKAVEKEKQLKIGDSNG